MAPSRKWVRIAGLVLHVLLGALMIFAGVMKLAGMMPPADAPPMDPGIASHLKLIGAGELIAAVLMIVPLTSSLGVLLTSGFWGGVICIHMAKGEDFLLPSGFLLLTWVGAYLRDPRVLYSFTGSRAPAVEAPASL